MKATLCDICKMIIEPDNPYKAILELHMDGLVFFVTVHRESTGNTTIGADVCESCVAKRLPKLAEAVLKKAEECGPFDGKKHYKLDEHGQPVCPACRASTSCAYRNVKNLACWSCGSLMEKTS